MSKIRLLFAPENVGFADRIAAALSASGHQLVKDGGPAAAALVIWSPSAGASQSILSAARAALARRALVPVALGKAPPPPSFEHLWPMDLSGWNGDIADPRWRFVLDEIDLAIRRGVDVGAAAVSPPPTARPAAKMKIADKPKTAVTRAAPQKPAPDDIFAEPEIYRVADRPRPRIPFAALIAGCAVLGVAGGGAILAGRQASEPSARELAAPSPDKTSASPPVIAFIRQKDPQTDDVTPPGAAGGIEDASIGEPVENFQMAPDDGSLIAEGDADPDIAPSSLSSESGAAGEMLREGQPVATLEIAAEKNPPAEAAAVSPPQDASAQAPQDADPIAGLAWDATNDAEAESPLVGRYLRDCVDCPDLAEIDAGALMPDIDADADAAPVMLRKRIAVAVRETTYDDWAACVADSACPARPDNGWGSGKRPVINVSWSDAEAYVRWLSGKTGVAYRLPTESEWEYAARAGSSDAFSFGPDASADKANFDAPRGARRRTLPVASFAPNKFGLYDMHGNVAEWTADCWSGEAQSGVQTASAGLCSARVIKGGAWDDGAADLRASGRKGDAESARRNNLGFRVVRDLP